MPGRKYDWELIRQDYVTSDITAEKLSAKYGAAATTIGKRAAKERWTEARENYRRKVAKKTEDNSAAIQAKRRSKMLRIADSMTALGLVGLQRMANDIREDPTKRLDLVDVRLLLKDANEMERRALGMADIIAMSDEEVLNALDAEIKRAVTLAEREATDADGAEAAQ